MEARQPFGARRPGAARHLRLSARPTLRSCGYWFPRTCPRIAVWSTPTTSAADRREVLGPSTSRVHLVAYPWLRRLQEARVFAYRFDAGRFEPYGDGPEPYAWVAHETVVPLGPPEPLGDLLALHERAGIELRMVPDLAAWWARVRTSSLGFSGIRLPAD